uniref:Transforming acidic coiled-coil containing protein 3 n=1 Tax=Sphenodon punctatus TaxID=8508 RepID=A0A8D0HAG7_SPHPU
MTDETSIAPYPDDEMLVKSQGTYNIDFDNLNDIDPFKSSAHSQNSPASLKQSPVGVPKSSEKSFENTSGNSPLLDVSIPSTSLLATAVPERTDLNGETSDSVAIEALSLDVMVSTSEPKLVPENEETAKPSSEEACKTEPESAPVQQSPPHVQTSYSFDPDSTDITDPFKMGGSKLLNSPIADKILTESSKPQEEAGITKAEPVKLEFYFTEAPTKKPPPRNLGKRTGIKIPSKKPAVTREKTLANAAAKDENKMEGEMLSPKASYNFDWDKFDDPNFNPFGGGGIKVCSSPEHPVPNTEKSSLEEDASTTTERTSPIQQSDKARGYKTAEERDLESQEAVKQSGTAEPAAKSETEAEPSGEVALKNTSSVTTTDISCQDNLTASGSGTSPQGYQELEPAASMKPEVSENVNGQVAMSESDEFFRSPTEVLGMDIEIDYLEQFGTSSFKESALRKQSLYLKFDPLLRESPPKVAPATNETIFGIVTPSESGLALETRKPTIKAPQKESDGLELLGAFPEPDLAPLIPDATTSYTSPFSLVNMNAADDIIEMLKYSQKDMDVAIEKVKLEVEEKEMKALEWETKYNQIYLECQEMGKIVMGYEGTVTQVLEDAQNQKELLRRELQKVLDEKQQVQSDLNSMEKSFSDLFKRYEKQKEVLEGFHKNEEALKTCVEDYLTRIKKEEQRYQALKAHAEEKLSRANEEITQVRNKGKAEMVALEANLRKQQMRIQSLERSLEQKTKENDELTKICDDLISKMEKISS